MTPPRNTRRRGDGLLESLFDATIKLLEEVPLSKLTFQQIAEAANTSRTVLYRRWSTTFDLLQDIYVYQAKKLFEGVFFETLRDTGSLRTDLIELLSLYQKVYSEIGSEVLITYYSLRARDPEHTKEPEIHFQAVDKHLQTIVQILHKAEERGEHVKPMSQVTLMLPFDMIRMENLVRSNNMDTSRIETMVDEVLLPVFKE